MFCPICGKTNPDDSKFCEGCGANMTEAPAAAPQAKAYQPAAPAAPVYAAPVYQQVPAAQPQYAAQPAYSANDLNKPLGVWGFIGTFIVLAIPLVNLIMLFVWAFGSSTNKNRKNFCRAALIMAVIGIILGIVCSIVFAAMLPDLMQSMQDLMEQYGFSNFGN